MSKSKKKRKRTPFTQTQVDMIRTVVREEIALSARRRVLCLPETVEVVPTLFSVEDVIGESEIDRARKKLAAGIDLTPTNFPLPPGASYFGRDDDGKELKPGFTDAYLQRLQAGDDPRDAYARTCDEFLLPVSGKAS